MTWDEPYLKTWLSWPQFDARDHEYCPVLDQNNVKAPMQALAASLLPYSELTLESHSARERRWMEPWVCESLWARKESQSFPLRVWQRW